jgi:basic amino acid/polyamine antiporter, APA family
MAARVHPRFGTPLAAIAIQSGVATVLVLLGNFRSIVAYFIFITVAFVGLTIAGLFRIRRKGDTGSPYETPGYPLTPTACLIAIAVLLVVLAAASPLQAIVGTAVVALGLPVFEYLKRTAPVTANHQPEEQERFTSSK